MTDRLSQRVSTLTIFLVLLVVDCSYQLGVRHLTWVDGLCVAVPEAALCTAILMLTTRLDLARVTVCYLALPYLLFLPSWLNLPAALIVSTVFLYCLTRTLLVTTAGRHDTVTMRDLGAFVLVLVWVNLSGAGGYGFQTTDYAIHNARLLDLIDYAWPVRYGKDQNFVFYMGYFLPSAVVGKLTSYAVALRSMYVWTVLGAVLALRWMSHSSGWRFSAGLVAVFALFGPMDILNVLTLSPRSAASLGNASAEMLSNPDVLDFRTSDYLGFFLGNFLSNTYQLYWSPHQVISGWLAAGLMTHLFLMKQTTSFVFVYSLLCVWAPLVMIALLPFVITAAAFHWFHDRCSVITIENSLGAGSLAAVFVIFYAAGSGSANPSFWIMGALEGGYRKAWALVLFYLFAWGVYAAAVTPFVWRSESRYRVWFSCLVVTMGLLPLWSFGEWSDLLCRGSAPLMFLLLVFILRATRHYWSGNRRATAVGLLCLLLSGAGSALLQIRMALLNYGRTRSVRSIVTYSHAYPNLGPDDTLFEKLLRRSLPERPRSERGGAPPRQHP